MAPTTKRIEERPSIETLLAGLDREQLQALLLVLVEQQPELVNLLETYVSSLRVKPPATTAKPAEPRERRTPIDVKPFRRRISEALRYTRYDDYGGAATLVAALQEVLDDVQPFIEAGDGPNALAILEAVTEEYLERWMDVDDSDGEAGDAVRDLGAVWTEAILSTDLEPDERRRWSETIARLKAEYDDYGTGEAFEAARQAALEGWDDPGVQRALLGEAPPSEEEQPRSPAVRELAEARLRLLDRQGRTDEYLNLAAADGLHVERATMLVRLGRIQEAAEVGLRAFTTPAEALALAKALHEHGATAEALRIGQHGLHVPPPVAPTADEGDRLARYAATRAESSYSHARGTLAVWLRDTATAAGEQDVALEAAIVAMRDNPSLTEYLAVQPLASERWPTIREELLAHLRQAPFHFLQAQVDVFLHEGRVDDAIAVVDAIPYMTSYYHPLVERVAEAAAHTHPDWAMSTGRKHAEPVMNGAKSQYYGQAARWLEIGAAAAKAAGRQAEWRTYLDELLDVHRRKRSLVPLLQRVRAAA
ncbi:MAG: hypothetical protein HY332_18520 [Chloroflexi bacterium]|nr:hypothetical protein [Chloroflexota bacterium]